MNSFSRISDDSIDLDAIADGGYDPEMIPLNPHSKYQMSPAAPPLFDGGHGAFAGDRGLWDRAGGAFADGGYEPEMIPLNPHTKHQTSPAAPPLFDGSHASAGAAAGGGSFWDRAGGALHSGLGALSSWFGF